MFKPLAWLLVAGLTGPSLALAQERDAPPRPTGTGRIAGTVIDAESGRAVRFARVMLSPESEFGGVVTDDAGRFVFDKLVAGDYTLHVSKTGYLETQYGQARPGTETPGRPIRLRDGERLDRVEVRISHGASISGVVRDDRGDPVFPASVVVYRWGTHDGVRRLRPVQTAETDERGRYRVSMLPPRDYVVGAAAGDDVIPQGSPGTPMLGFAPAFFPGGPSPQQTSTLSLRLGEERADIDFQLPVVPLGKVTGLVVDADGKPVPELSVALTGAGSDGPESVQSMSTDARGRFEFERVLPGAYVISAGDDSGAGLKRFHGDMISLKAMSVHLTVATRDVQLSKVMAFEAIPPDKPDKDEAPRPERAPRGTAESDVNVTGGAATDVLLTLQPSREISGRLVFEGQTPRPDLGGMRVSATGIGRGTGFDEAKLNQDGTFTIGNLSPGRYALGLPGLNPPWSIASAMSGGADALDLLLEVPRDRDVRDLTITIRDRAAELKGSVAALPGQTTGDHLVVLFPVDERFWVTGPMGIFAAPVVDGQFVFSGLRAGSYRLAVIEAAEPDDWLDPSFLRRLIPASVPVNLGDGEKKVQNLRVK
jgi:hypothetical protein